MPHLNNRNKKNEKTVAFMVARLSSSRLPKKQFRKIGPYTILEWIYRELKKSEEIDEIVLATVAEAANEPLKDWCKTKDIPCFWYRGEIDHVTTRLRKAAEEFCADICVLISGDCPLIYAPAIDNLIAQLRQHNEADVISVISDSSDRQIALQGVGVARRRAWQLADDISDLPELKEHHFPVIGKRPDLFKIHRCTLPKDLYTSFSHRFSVDTWADLEFMNTLYSELDKKGKEFSLPNVLELISQKPDIMTINAHVHQMLLGEKSKKVLIIADAGRDYGYGHIMRSRELALQITERLGWPVTFMTDDNTAKDILNNVGIRSIKFYNELFSAKDARQAARQDSPFKPYDLIILDLYHKRSLPTGWRKLFPRKARIIVLDQTAKWTEEADRIIIPSIIYDSTLPAENRPKILWGSRYIIIRREIEHVRAKHLHKDIDMLVYLHDQDQLEAVKKIAASSPYKISIIQGFKSDFSELMARSRMFVSGFGQSFYEAVFLKTYPICLPDSLKHEQEALLFYKNTGLAPQIIHKLDDLKNFKETLSFPEKISIESGVKNIVSEIKNIN